MSAEVFQEIAAVGHSFVDIKARNASRRSRCDALTFRQDDGRAVILLRQARSHDADHPFVPLLIVDYDRAALF